jgi:hypothetical protein
MAVIHRTALEPTKLDLLTSQEVVASYTGEGPTPTDFVTADDRDGTLYTGSGA